MVSLAVLVLAAGFLHLHFRGDNLHLIFHFTPRLSARTIVVPTNH
jgi:hypothetical protein